MNCPRCEGTGKCSDCQGSGFCECLNCQGLGHRVSARGTKMSCKSCQGEGRTECPKSCSSCNGAGVITEEFQQETRSKYRPKFADFSPRQKVVLPLLVLNVLVFVAVQNEPTLGSYFMLDQSSLSKWEFWKLLTPSFLHLDLWHIGLNLIFLWRYGPFVEGLLGGRRFLSLYLFSAFTAGLVSWVGNVLLEGGYWAGIGASGPLYGLVGGLLAIHLRWRMVPGDTAKRLGTWFGAFILIGFAAQFNGYGFLDNWGHLGGLVGGFLLTYLSPRPGGQD